MTKAATYLGQYWPVTQEFGLIEAPLDDVATAYEEWWRMTGIPLTRTSVKGGLGAALDALTPLTARLTRRVLVPTTGRWTGFFQNGIDGSAVAEPMRSLARRMGVRALRLARKPGTYAPPETALEMYAARAMGGDDTGLRRAIRAWRPEGSRTWSFHEAGMPFRFEMPDEMSARPPAKRFTPAHLAEYAERLGVGVLDDALFAPGATSVLFTAASRLSAPPDYSLFDVLSGKPWA